MPSGNPIDKLILHFDCSLDEEPLLEILQRVAMALHRRPEELEFRRTRQQLLSDPAEDPRAREEVWKAKGVRIDIRIMNAGVDQRAVNDYELFFQLTLDTGFRLELNDRSPEPRLSEVEVRLYRLWPEQFDAVRRIFQEYLGEEADLTDAPRLATLNAEAALDAGLGAFARHLVDQAKERYEARADLRLQETEKSEWWPKLKALSEELRGS